MCLCTHGHAHTHPQRHMQTCNHYRPKWIGLDAANPEHGQRIRGIQDFIPSQAYTANFCHLKCAKTGYQKFIYLAGTKKLPFVILG